MGETKRVATQNIKFAVSVNSVWKSVFGTLVQPSFWCNKKTDYFSIDWFVTTPKNFDWNLDATNRTWKLRGNWVRTSLWAKIHRNFWEFRTIRFLLQGRKSTYFQPKRLFKIFVSDWDRDRRNHASTNGETWFWKSSWFENKNLQCVFGHQYFNTRIELKTSQSIPSLQLESFRLTRWWEKPNRLICFNRLIWDNSKKSIEVLMLQFEPQNFEKIELGYRDKLKFIETFGTFGPSGFCCKEENRHLPNLNVCSKLNLFDWDQDGRNHASTNGEAWFWKSRWFKNKNIQCVFGHQYFSTRINIKTSQSNTSLQS